MPDKVRNVQGKSEKHNEQQDPLHDLFPFGDFPVHHIEREQQKNCHAAVDVRPVIQPGLCFHIDKVTRQHFKTGEIGSKRLGDTYVTGGCQLQGEQNRDQQECGETAG